jgi:hypothetical protein
MFRYMFSPNFEVSAKPWPPGHRTVKTNQVQSKPVGNIQAAKSHPEFGGAACSERVARNLHGGSRAIQGSLSLPRHIGCRKTTGLSLSLPAVAIHFQNFTESSLSHGVPSIFHNRLHPLSNLTSVPNESTPFGDIHLEHIGRHGLSLSRSYQQGYSAAYNTQSHIKVVCNGYILAHVSNCNSQGSQQTLPSEGLPLPGMTWAQRAYLCPRNMREGKHRHFLAWILT